MGQVHPSRSRRKEGELIFRDRSALTAHLPHHNVELMDLLFYLRIRKRSGGLSVFPICGCSSWLRTQGLNMNRSVVSKEHSPFRYSSTLPCTDNVSGKRKILNEFWDQINNNTPQHKPTPDLTYGVQAFAQNKCICLCPTHLIQVYMYSLFLKICRFMVYLGVAACLCVQNIA